MRRCLPVLAALFSLTGVPGEVLAQQVSAGAALQRSSGPAARVVGFVTDESGAGISGVSIFALGVTLATVRTGFDGRFDLTLPAGDYVLKAALEGYISTYREAVRLVGDMSLRRHITLLKREGEAGDLVVPASTSAIVERETGGPASQSNTAGGSDRASSESVWRLRHLPRTVLRDESGASSSLSDDREEFDDVSMLAGPARAAASFLAERDLAGHVDFLTTSAVAGAGPPVPVDWPRGVAYVVLGAPVGRYGEWAVRAALTGGDSSSWTFLGEYVAREDLPHAFRTGVSYSAHRAMTDPVGSASPDAVRRVGGVYATDAWTVRRGLRVDYGVRLDRYDYLSDPNLVSGTLGVSQRIAPRVSVVAIVSPRMVAPGAEQFLPPSTSGTWLPPERTFSTLDAGGLLSPARIERYEIGADTLLVAGQPSASDDLTLRVRRFTERTSNQAASLFGLDEASQVGHYYISSPGDVRVEGWSVGLSGRFFEYLNGTVDYTATRADWTPGADWTALGFVAPASARRGTTLDHDLTSSLEATVPVSSTRVAVAWRMNTGFSRHAWDQPSLASRFAVQISQQLPVRPLGHGELNLLLSARTLLHELQQAGAYYDELLTVAPPLRLTCGLQMRF